MAVQDLLMELAKIITDTDIISGERPSVGRPIKNGQNVGDRRFIRQMWQINSDSG
jgi:hypothetical protein